MAIGVIKSNFLINLLAHNTIILRIFNCLYCRILSDIFNEALTSKFYRTEIDVASLASALQDCASWNDKNQLDH